MFSSVGRSAWPDSPWINGAPNANATVTAVAFVSPLDLQLFKVMDVWKRLEKRYRTNNVDFLIVAMAENSLPFSQTMVEATAKEATYNLPILLDPTASYAKQWRAYVSPTINLVLKNGKVTSQDPGNFDPALFEKSLQKILKDNGVAGIPAREFINDGETKTCGHSKTQFLGEEFQKAWTTPFSNFDENWVLKGQWVEKINSNSGHLKILFSKTGLGVIVDSSRPVVSKIFVHLNDRKVPLELRGHDIQEDKNSETFITFKGPRNYELITKSMHLPITTSKITLSTTAPEIKILAIQTIPHCQDF